MNKISLIFTILLTTLCLNAQDGLDNPITKAMMRVYQQQLDEDHKDYETYFKRANEYYNHNQYVKALSDINNVLKHVPTSNSDMRFQSLCLRASIYELTDNLENALCDLNEAYNIDPNSYMVIYRRANVEYLLKRYSESKADYQRMLRINNRSIEALIGLSRIAVSEKNLGLANEYADNAVSLAPNDSEVYMRRASVRRLMGNNIGAVDDLILALASDNQNYSKALHELVEISQIDYNATVSGLSNAIRQAPKVGMYYYIRGIIAKANYNYVAALADLKKIIHENLYNYHGIYKEIADCQYFLGAYDDAIYNINFAINMSTENSEYYVVKSKILRALGQSSEALDCCNKALSKNQNLTAAISEKGLCLSDLSNYDSAIVAFGEAALNEANNPLNYLLRADILKNKLEQDENAKSIYERIIELDCDSNDVKSLKGFALLSLGKTEEAITWIENIVSSKHDSNGLICYYAACIYSHVGDITKAIDYANKSMQKGYANYHQWTKDSDANINISPIRNNTEFINLLNQHSAIFK